METWQVAPPTGAAFKVAALDPVLEATWDPIVPAAAAAAAAAADAAIYYTILHDTTRYDAYSTLYYMLYVFCLYTTYCIVFTIYYIIYAILNYALQYIYIYIYNIYIYTIYDIRHTTYYTVLGSPCACPCIRPAHEAQTQAYARGPSPRLHMKPKTKATHELHV